MKYLTPIAAAIVFALIMSDANALTQIQTGCHERSGFTYCNP